MWAVAGLGVLGRVGTAAQLHGSQAVSYSQRGPHGRALQPEGTGAPMQWPGAPVPTAVPCSQRGTPMQ